MKYAILITLCAALLFSCTSNNTSSLKEGLWRAEIDIQGQGLPFVFEVIGETPNQQVIIRNGTEELLLDNVKIVGDSVSMELHIFDSELKARINGDNLVGYWTKRYVKDYILPFSATFGNNARFAVEEETSIDFSGKWKIKFETEEIDSLYSIGVFEQKGSIVTGSILTVTGDYRYLEGVSDGNQLKLSTFDGSHAFLFKATEKDGQLEGDFWSGKDWHEKWTAVRDDSAAIADADQLTFLREGFNEITFSFPDLNGDTLRFPNNKYDGKVVILQIFGTACPNCMDESRFLAKWYSQNKDKNVEILGLAYEAGDFDYASSRVQKVANKLDISYDFVIAGKYTKAEAGASLPMLNHVFSFPTTIFIDKYGKVRKIHTGFSGPGTGDYYTSWVDEFNLFVDGLLAEPAPNTGS